MSESGSTIGKPHLDQDGASASRSDGRNAFLVGAGIFLSRIAGLIRDRIFAHYFGNSAAADAFRAAFRIPNLLQNLFGEGSLSASFIPVYVRLRAEGNEAEARKVASGVAATLGLVISLLVVLGVLAAPMLVTAIAPGFAGEKRELTVHLVRILFPGAGLLVCSAWCLGILNSHRRFFLSYAAPILWNLAIIAALAWFGPGREQYPLAGFVAWGSVAGSAMQLLVQLPPALRLTGGLRLSFHWTLASVRTVLANFVPVFFSRGVVQVSAFVDELLCSWLPHGAFAAFSYAQTLYVLPVSLFGMSVSASQLPEMSGAIGDQAQVAEQLRRRLDAGLRRIVLFVIPSAMGFLALGDVVVAALYRTGQFGSDDVRYVWATLAGATVGMLASTQGRLYSSAYFAGRDTRTPLRYAIVRISLTAGLGYVFSLQLPGWIGIPERWGVTGLTISAGISGWVEFFLLRHTLNLRIGRTGLPAGLLLKLWFSAAVGAGLGFGLKQLLTGWHPISVAVLALGAYGAAYFSVAALLKVEEARAVIRRSLKLAGAK